MQIEQRKFRRYNLSLPVRVWSKSRASHVVAASTRDISARGIYLVLSQEFELGTDLELEITLPLKLAGGHVSLIRCRGKLSRIERIAPEGKIGIGTTIDYFEFSNESPSATDQPPVVPPNIESNNN